MRCTLLSFVLSFLALAVFHVSSAPIARSSALDGSSNLYSREISGNVVGYGPSPPSLVEAPIPQNRKVLFRREDVRLPTQARLIRRESIGDKIKNFFKNAGNKIKQGFQKVGNAFKTAGQKIKQGFQHVGNKIKQGFHTVKKAFQHAGNKIKQGFQHVGNKIKQGFHTVKKAFQHAGNKIKQGFQHVGNKIKQGFHAVKKAFQHAGNKIKQGFQTAGRKIKEGFQTAGRKMKEGFIKAGHWIKENGGKVVKFGLKIATTAASLVAKAAGFIPVIGKAAGKIMGGIAKATDFVAKYIPGKLDPKLQKGMDVMDKIQHPFSGAAGAVFDAVLKRDLEHSS